MATSEGTYPNQYYKQNKLLILILYMEAFRFLKNLHRTRDSMQLIISSKSHFLVLPLPYSHPKTSQPSSLTCNQQDLCWYYKSMSSFKVAFYSAPCNTVGFFLWSEINQCFSSVFCLPQDWLCNDFFL